MVWLSFYDEVPSDHFLVRVKHQVLHNPELYSQEKLQYFNHMFVLHDIILNVAEPFLEQANRVLKRVYPCGLEARSNRLRRYYWLVKDVAAVYVFGELSDDKKQVIGDTGWAVQMGLDLDKSVYVFCLKEKQWFSYSAYTLAEKGNAYQKVMKFAATQNPPTLAISSALVGH